MQSLLLGFAGSEKGEIKMRKEIKLIPTKFEIDLFGLPYSKVKIEGCVKSSDLTDARRISGLDIILRDKESTSDNYSELKRVLGMAYNQAAEGKGKERHANGEKFEDQPIMTIAKGHGLGYQTGQAAKKLQEAHTLLKLRGKHAAIQEILGAINYAAAAVLLIEQMEDEGEKK